MEPLRTAVLPVAGLGTRFLPATKVMPKELAPIVDRPAIQYVIEEAVHAGLDDVLLITATGKDTLVDHFDRRQDLEDALEAKGKTNELEQVRALSELASVHTIRQGLPLGLGHAVLQARGHVGNRGFAVLLPDDLLDPDVGFLDRMVAAHQRAGRAVVALMRVPRDQIHLYGVATATETDEPGVYDVRDLVEKPDADEAPSDLAVIGRYVLPGDTFDVLDRTEPGKGGEIQLTDALRTMATEEPIVGVRYDGVRHDTGDKLGFLKATVDLAARRADLGPAFLDWLGVYVDEHRS